jgi:hypothetical protein
MSIKFVNLAGLPRSGEVARDAAGSGRRGRRRRATESARSADSDDAWAGRVVLTGWAVASLLVGGLRLRLRDA